MNRFDKELRAATQAATQAAEVIMSMYHSAAVETKSDGSFVTEADFASDATIREILGERFPDDAFLTEESQDDGRRLLVDRCWVIDPIDGTESFVSRTGDFDVYIALIEHGRPVVAVSLQPTTGLLLTAVAGDGAWFTPPGGIREPITFATPGDAIRLGTRGWLGAPGNVPWLERVARHISPCARAVNAHGGLGARSFLQPGAYVDAFVGRMMNGSPIRGWEWDIAVVDLIVREAGGCATDLTGSQLKFNQPNPQFTTLLISIDDETHQRTLAAIAATPV